MASPLFTNNAAVFLTTGVAATDLSVALPAGTGANFPSPSGGDWFMLTLENLQLARREIVKVTARSSDTLTVVRAQEGTTAQIFPATTSVAAHRLTAGVLAYIISTLVTAAGALPSITGNALKTLRANAGETAVEYYAPPYDVALFIESTMTASETVMRFVAPRAFSLPSGASGSYAIAGTAAAASTTLTLYKNGVSFGTLVWALAGTSATVTIASTTSFAAGDVLAIVGSATADTTLANIAITLAGTRS